MIPLPAPAPRPPLESDVMRAILAALAATADVRVFRNNSGKLRDENGSVVAYGLGIGSPDLVGSIAVRAIGVAMSPPYATIANGLCFPIARSLALEVKRPGWKPRGVKEREHFDRQLAWLQTARNRGWVAEVVYSVDEAMAVVGRARRWEI